MLIPAREFGEGEGEGSSGIEGHRTERYMYYVPRQKIHGIGRSRERAAAFSGRQKVYIPRYIPPAISSRLSPPSGSPKDFSLHDPNKSWYPAGDLIR